MAIAFFVDPAYGPIPQTNNNPVIPVVSNENNSSTRRQPVVTIDENNNHVIPDLIHGVANFPQFQQNRNQVFPTRNIFQRFLQYFCNSGNSRRRAEIGSLQRETSDDSHGNHLPDLIQPCHQGFFFNVSLETEFRSRQPRLDESNSENTPRRRCRRPAERQVHNHPIPLPTNHPSSILLQNQEEEEDWNFHVKFEVDICREIGEDLRRIGDQFALEFESSIQRSQERESFQVRCMVTLTTLPALAIVGLVTGLAYLRHRL